MAASNLCVLVLNISHEDVVLQLASSSGGAASSSTTTSSSSSSFTFDRPAFSSFDSVARSVASRLDAVATTTAACASIAGDDGRTIAAGFQLSTRMVSLVGSSSVATAAAAAAAAATGVPVERKQLHHAARRGGAPSSEITAVYFPLVVTALALWLKKTLLSSRRCRRIVYLISGAGTPSDPNGSSEGNSTHEASLLIARFIRFVHSELEVHTVDSGAGVFEHAANVRFVNSTLRPQIMAHVERIAADAAVENWKEHMHLCIALTSGSPARISAITNGLRYFEPDFIHVFRLKTFIYTKMIDLGATSTSFASFADVETSSAVSAALCSEDVQAVAREMLLRRAAVEKVIREGSELSSFWLRKTRKPVLAVLVVQKRGGARTFYHGMYTHCYSRGERTAVSSYTSQLTLLLSTYSRM